METRPKGVSWPAYECAKTLLYNLITKMEQVPLLYRYFIPNNFKITKLWSVWTKNVFVKAFFTKKMAKKNLKDPNNRLF